MFLIFQLTNIKSNLDRSAKLKFRGHNISEQKRTLTPQTYSSQIDLTNTNASQNTVGRRSISSADHSNILKNLEYIPPNHEVNQKRHSYKHPIVHKKEIGQVGFRMYKDSRTLPKTNKKKFPRSESLEAFPPLTKKFPRRQHSRSP